MRLSERAPFSSTNVDLRLINPLLNRDYDNNPSNIHALKMRGSMDHGSTV